MIKRTCHFSCKLLFEIIAAVVVGIMILLFAFIYKISNNPIKITKLTPYIQDSVLKIDPNINFNTDDAWLSFEDNAFKVAFDNVYVSYASQSLIDIKRIDLSFTLTSLIKAMPAKIEAKQANVMLQINEDGAFSLQGIKGSSEQKDNAPVPQRISKILMNPQAEALEQIMLADSNVFFENKITGDKWTFNNIDILFERDENDNVLGGARIAIQNQVFDVSSIYYADSFKTGLNLAFQDLKLSDFQNRYEKLKDLPLTISGDISVSIDEDLKIEDVGVLGDVKNGSKVVLNDFYSTPLPVSGEFDVIYKDQVITSKQLDLTVGALKTNNKVKIDLSNDLRSLAADINVNYIDFSKALEHWPEGVAQGAKNWIVNHMPSGDVDSVNCKLALSSDADLQNISLNSLSGYIDFSKLKLKYLETMPGVDALKGKAKFSQDGFDIDVYEGSVKDVNLTAGSKVIIPFEDSVVSVLALMKGNLHTVADTINHEPLKYMDAIKISPDDVSGEMDGSLKLDIPTNGDNIQVEVNANLDQVAINKLIFGQDLRTANGSLKVTNDKVEVDASGIFDKANVHVVWDEFFADDAKYDRVAEIVGEGDVKIIKDLGVIDLTKQVTSRVPIQGLYKSKSGTGSVILKSDLVGTNINLSPIPYKKSADEYASLEVSIKLKDNNFDELDSIKLIDEDIELSGWYDDNILYLSKLSMPENNIDVSGHYMRKEGRVPNIDISGTIGKNAILKIVPKNGVNTINFDIEDLGSSLKSLELFKKLRGGKLSLNGKSKVETPSLLKGRLTMTDFNVVDMDVLTTILGAMSLDGLSSALSGDGITFEKLQADFTWDHTEHQFKFKDGKTSGSSLGLTFDNIWDTENNTIAMKGTVAPLQGLSRAVGSIPIIGTVLTGSDQEGIFGAKYMIKGPVSDLDVDVNTASSLTPGILRDIFFSGDSLKETIEKENIKKEKVEDLEESIEREEEELNRIRGIQ